MKRIQEENTELKKMIGFILNTLQVNKLIQYNTETRQYELIKK